MNFHERALVADLRDYGNEMSKPFREGRTSSVMTSICEHIDPAEPDIDTAGPRSTEIQYRAERYHDTDCNQSMYQYELSFQQWRYRMIETQDLACLPPAQLKRMYDDLRSVAVSSDNEQCDEGNNSPSIAELRKKIFNLAVEGFVTKETNSINIILEDQEGIVDFHHWHDTTIGSYRVKSDDVIETDRWPRPRRLTNGNTVRNLDGMPSQEILPNTEALLIGKYFSDIIETKKLTIGNPVETEERRIKIAYEIARRLFARDLGDPLRTDILS